MAPYSLTVFHSSGFQPTTLFHSNVDSHSIFLLLGEMSLGVL